MREVFRAHEISRVVTTKLKITPLLLTTIVFGPVAFAGTDTAMTGVYHCASYNVSGGGGSCRYMQTLVLSADGSYRYSTTHGRWYMENGKLVLSRFQTVGSRNGCRKGYCSFRIRLPWLAPCRDMGLPGVYTRDADGRPRPRARQAAQGSVCRRVVKAPIRYRH